MPDVELPAVVPPMLAKSSKPFDSDDHLFEIKWDGARAITYVDRAGFRLVNRRKRDMVPRYPEFDFLRTLEPGLILDGEIVVLRDGKPDFHRLLKREQTHKLPAVRHLAQTMPATYVVFDLLYRGFKPQLRKTLEVRRAGCEEVIAAARQPTLVFSGGVVGGGRPYFQEACDRGLEGVVAKRLGSRYLPGKRTDAWVKIKRSETIYCAIIGFIPAGKDDFRSLIIAAEEDGTLRCVGRVGSGIDERARAQLNALLWPRLRKESIVAATIQGRWVEPGLYCTVSYLERTPAGELRAPVFKGLIDGTRDGGS